MGYLAVLRRHRADPRHAPRKVQRRGGQQGPHWVQGRHLRQAPVAVVRLIRGRSRTGIGVCRHGNWFGVLARVAPTVVVAVADDDEVEVVGGCRARGWAATRP